MIVLRFSNFFYNILSFQRIQVTALGRKKKLNFTWLVEVKLYIIFSVIPKLHAVETPTEIFFQYEYTCQCEEYFFSSFRSLPFDFLENKLGKKQNYVGKAIRLVLRGFGEELCVIELNSNIKFYFRHYLYPALFSFGAIGISRTQT